MTGPTPDTPATPPEGRCAKCQQTRPLFKWAASAWTWDATGPDVWLCSRDWSDVTQAAEDADTWEELDDLIDDLAEVATLPTIDVVIAITGGTQ